MKRYSFREVLHILKDNSRARYKTLLEAIFKISEQKDSDSERLINFVNEHVSRISRGIRNVPQIYCDDIAALTDDERHSRMGALATLIGHENLIVAIQAIRDLVNEQVVYGFLFPEEADELCGKEEFSASEYYDIDEAQLALWRLVVGSIGRNNIKAKEIQGSLEEHFGKRLVPGKTASILVGRTAEIEEIQLKLDKENCIFVTGLPGIGKSKVAEAVVDQTWDRGNVLWLRYEGSMRQTILGAGCLTASRFASDDERYRHVIKLLNVCGEKLLVVLDNANSIDPNDEGFKAFCEGKYTKLVLTRDEWVKQDFTHVTIGTLSKDELRQIYINNKYGITTKKPKSPKEDGTSEEIGKLIEGAHSNTFAVELMGKLVAANRQLQSKLCQELQGKQGVVLSEDLPFIVISHDRTQEATIKEHLLWLVSSRKYGEVEQRILGLFALLSVYGVPKTAIYQWGGNRDGNLKAVNKLVQHGLLVQEDSEDGEEYISLHPLLRDIFYEKFKCKSGDFPFELKGVLEELEQPRGLWMQNLLCISERMQQWEAKNAEEFLRFVFMKTVEYGLEDSARMIRREYVKAPVGIDGGLKDRYEQYMSGTLLWKYPTDEGNLEQAEMIFDTVQAQCNDRKTDCPEEYNLWMRSGLALADITWRRGQLDATEEILENVLVGACTFILTLPQLAEEMFSAMSHYEKLFEGYPNLMESLENVRYYINTFCDKKKLNWLKLNLSFARIARGTSADAQEIMKYLDDALAYGESHHLQESLEYLETKELKERVELELCLHSDEIPQIELT